MAESSGANQQANGAVLSFDATSPTPTRERKHPLLEHWQPVVFVLGVVLAAGGLIVTVNRLSGDMDTVKGEIRDVQLDVRAIATKLGVETKR